MRLFLLALKSLLIISCALTAKEVCLCTKMGKAKVIDVLESDLFFEVATKIAPLIDLEDCRDELIIVAGHQGGYLGCPRDYYVSLTSSERADIRYIVTSLANRSLASILFHKSDLEAAGNRIDHVHPLRFLECVFTTEEYKVGIRNIRGRGWIWGDFIGGIKSSLDIESDLGNMTYEMICDFSSIVGIKPELIIPSIQNRNWDKFVDLLITHIPRQDDGNRYDD